MVYILWCVLGLASLIAGAELLVGQSTRLATLAGVPPIVIGLTIVALGTSAPELAIGIDSALLGKGSLAVGNIAGTNTVNILLILGLSAWLLPLTIEKRTLQYDLPAIVVAAAALVVMAADGLLTPLEGSVLVLGAFAYTAGIVFSAGRERSRVKAEFAREFGTAAAGSNGSAVFTSLVWLALSVALVVLGADWLVHGATGLAQSLGVSNALVGLTIVAIGTSSPELVTTIVSTIRNQRDIAIGNLIGSSAYNILAILGLTVLASRNGIVIERQLVLVDIPVSGLAALVCIPVFLSSRQVTRTEGALFVGLYMLYLGYLLVLRT